MGAIEGRMADLYDVFVDWEGRLGREMPGLTRRLREADARRVLDVGCGTGRHVRALLNAGFDAHGADVSDDMLARALACVGDETRLHAWRLGDPAPDALAAASPFDAVVCLGNVWPQITGEADVAAALAALRGLLRPGGLLLVGLKAVAVRRDAGNPYLPLLKREHEGRALFFVRFADFAVPHGDDGAEVCDFHMTVVAGDGTDTREPAALLHRVSRMRVWSPAGLEAAFAAAGFGNVHASARLDDPSATPEWEDVFVHAQAP
jgi:SAM-dependent methyltransferase